MTNALHLFALAIFSLVFAILFVGVVAAVACKQEKKNKITNYPFHGKYQ